MLRLGIQLSRSGGVAGSGARVSVRAESCVSASGPPPWQQASALTTLINFRRGFQLDRFYGVIFTRADRTDIRTLAGDPCRPPHSVLFIVPLPSQNSPRSIRAGRARALNQLLLSRCLAVAGIKSSFCLATYLQTYKIRSSRLVPFPGWAPPSCSGMNCRHTDWTS